MKSDLKPYPIASECLFNFLLKNARYQVKFVMVGDESIYYVHFYRNYEFLGSERVKNKNVFGLVKHPNINWALRLLLDCLNT